jgi:hypothetical protein
MISQETCGSPKGTHPKGAWTVSISEWNPKVIVHMKVRSPIDRNR